MYNYNISQLLITVRSMKCVIQITNILQNFVRSIVEVLYTKYSDGVKILGSV